MSQRPTTEQQRAAIKAAMRRLVRTVGGQVEAAQCTRVGQPAVSRYASVNHPEEHVPVDVLMDLTLDADNPEVLRALCRLAGGVYVPVPEMQGGLPGLPGMTGLTSWPLAVGTIVQRSADAASAICTALNDDGKVSADEIHDLDLIDKLGAGIEAMARLQILARSILEREGGG